MEAQTKCTQIPTIFPISIVVALTNFLGFTFSGDAVIIGLSLSNFVRKTMAQDDAQIDGYYGDDDYGTEELDLSFLDESESSKSPEETKE